MCARLGSAFKFLPSFCESPIEKRFSGPRGEPTVLSFFNRGTVHVGQLVRLPDCCLHRVQLEQRLTANLFVT